MRRALGLLLALLLTGSLYGCEARYRKYSATRYDLFDTYITLTGYALTESAFAENANRVFAELERYDALFDAYEEHGDVVGLYAVNARAAVAPVAIAQDLFELLAWCKSLYGGKSDIDGLAAVGYATRPVYDRVNIAMGAVLALWHDCREAALADASGASVPSIDALAEAATHCDMGDVVLDAELQTVYFADPLLRLDLGAVAKGWVADRCAELLRGTDMPSFLLNLGGNVLTGNQPLDGRASWSVSVADPDDPSGRLALLHANNASVVTSGDYQRYFEMDGVRYHHIIDPDTLAPSAHVRAVTVVAPSSALADWLSTTLMLLPYEEGRLLADRMDAVEALWMCVNGDILMTDGMRALAEEADTR